jgi:hypothetical protein
VFLGQGRYEFFGAGRPTLFTVVEQQRNVGVVLEANIVQNFQCGNCVDDAGLLVAYAGPIGMLAVRAERAPRHRSWAKHSVYVRNDQNSALAGAMQGRHQIVRKSRSFRRLAAHFSADGRQASCQHRFDFVAAGNVPGAGVDVYDFMEKVECARAVGCCGLVNVVIPTRGGLGARAEQQHRGHGNNTRGQ